MSIFNSIVTCHRDRLWSLKAFFKSIYISSRYVDKNSFEVIITDLHEDTKSDKIIDKYKDKINIRHLKYSHSGEFLRGKALNCSVSNASGRYITVLDIDTIVTPFFLKDIEDYYLENDNNIKLAYRIKYLDKFTVFCIIMDKLDENFILKIMRDQSKFRNAIERYTLRYSATRKKELPLEWINGQALGNSHFTMLREDFLTLGGYDERMKGWGCEDLDFNRRAYSYLGGGYIRTDPPYIIYNMSPHVKKSKRDRSQTYKNWRIYKENRDNNIICILKNSGWGQFGV